MLQTALSALEESSADHVNEALPRLIQDAAQTKEDLLRYLEDVHINFLHRPKTLEKMANRINKLMDVKDDVVTSAGNIKSDMGACKYKIEDCQLKIEKVNTELGFVRTVCDIHNGIIELKNETLKAFVTKLREINELLKTLPLSHNNEVYESLFNQLYVVQSQFSTKLTEDFENLLKIEVIGNRHSLTISDNVAALVEAAYFYQKEAVFLEWDAFIQNIWKLFFCPIIEHSATAAVRENTFSISINKKAKDDYKLVYFKLGQLTEYLYTNFSAITLEDESFLTMIGEKIKDDLCEGIINNCLENNIPTNEVEMKEYEQVIKATEVLQNKFNKLGFIKNDMLLDYAKNVDVHYINNICKKYFDQANQILQGDLHDSVIVELPQKAAISKNVLDYIKVIHEIMMVAIKSSEAGAQKLVAQAEDLILMYPQDVIESHKKLLETIPQQVALFYNNCYYLVHEFSQKKWRDLHQALPQNVCELAPYTRLISVNYCKGAEMVFNAFLDTQMNEIKEIMDGSGLSKLKELEDLNVEAAEKSMRQCIRKLELLRSVWSKTLPVEKYNTTIGRLLNSLCEYLIAAVLAPEDISATSADSLVLILKILDNRGPKLFHEAHEVQRHVSLWYKINEMAFVLQANLEGIDDRWADGKGPLALHFEPHELRGLIRALFQNTERRSKLLNKL